MARKSKNDDNQQADVKGGTVNKEPTNDLMVTGRDKTEVRAETKVIDRTVAAPEVRREWSEKEVKLAGGTVEVLRVDKIEEAE